MDLAVIQQVLLEHAYTGIFILLVLGAFGPSLPEEIVLVLAGFLIHQGAADAVLIGLLSLGGVVLSDTLIYALGYRYGRRFIANRWVTRIVPLRRTLRMRAWLRRYRYRLIFFGRYLYGLRPAVFLAAGLSRMKPAKFVAWDLLSTGFSIGLWVGLGYLFGGQIETLLGWLERWQQNFLALLALSSVFLVTTWLVDRAPLARRFFLQRLAPPQRLCAALATLFVLLFLLPIHPTAFHP